jgi:hypothetical protein
MGRERACAAEWDDARSTGKLLLETDELIFRGDRRLRIPLRDVTKAKAASGWLDLAWKGGRARFQVGDDAAEWAQRILKPKGRLEKLGITPTTRLRITGLRDPIFDQEVLALGVSPTKQVQADLSLLGCDTPSDLRRIATAARSLQGAQALWVVYPKGRKDVTETMVLMAGRAAGLTDIKVMRFSDTHTALKFVIPKDRR